MTLYINFKDAFIFHSYGIFLAQNLARLVIKRGYKPFVLIRHENDASQSLYKKLGFEKIFDMARIVYTPFEYAKENINANEKNGHEKNGNHVNGNAKCNGVNNQNI